MCPNFCRPLREHAHAALQVVVTPLEISSWVRALSSHPDQALVKYVSDGLREGFRVGFKWDSPLHSTRSNMQSARLHPQIITDYTARFLSVPKSFQSCDTRYLQVMPNCCYTSHSQQLLMIGNMKFAMCPRRVLCW